MSRQDIQIVTFPVGPLQCNCSVLWDLSSKEAVIVDPGADAARILKICQQNHLSVKWIIHTHAHFDHTGASSELHQKLNAPLCLHNDDKFLWENTPMQGQMFGMTLESPLPFSHSLNDSEEFPIGAQKLKVIFTPGHTPGSCCFSIDGILFAGDTLFKNSIGRTDLWGGSFDTIEKSIKQRLYTLDDDTQVICGHGPDTLIGKERRSNPFVQG